MFGYGYGYYSSYFIFMLPAILLALYAQTKINSNYSYYSRISNPKGLTGKEVAENLLRANGLSNIEVRPIAGTLTDNYNPEEETINLSEGVYNSTSIAAIGIAAHECGHAIQRAHAYAPYKLRAVIAPVAGFASRIAWYIIMAGFFLSPKLLDIGILAFLAIFLFQLVTLPVEWDASRRAKQAVQQQFSNQEVITGVNNVLNAAALTYLAALVSSLAQLLRIMSLRRRD